MIAFFEVLACVADSLIAVNFVSKANGSKLTELKCLVFSLIYFLFNVISVFSGLKPEYIIVFNLLLLFVLSFLTGSYKKFKTYVSPVCVIVVSGVISYIAQISFAAYMGMSFVDIVKKLSSSGLPRVYYLLITSLFSFLVLAFIIPIITKAVSFKIQDYFLMLLFPMTIFYVMNTMSWSVLVYAPKGIMRVYFPVIIMLFASLTGIYYTIYRLGKNNSEREKRLLYEQMLKYEEKRYGDIEGVLEQLRKIRHDMNHQLILVKMKLDGKDYNGAEKELEGIMDNVSNVGSIIKTNNKVIDYMVNTKLGSLPYASVMVTGELDGLSVLDEMDLSIIMGNLIDNAVEAVKNLESPKIELSIYQKDNYINMVFKNTVEKSVLESNPQLVTSKADKANHGYGLKSVKEIMERTKGDISFYEEDGLFVVHLMIQVKS